MFLHATLELHMRKERNLFSLFRLYWFIGTVQLMLYKAYWTMDDSTLGQLQLSK